MKAQSVDPHTAQPGRESRTAYWIPTSALMLAALLVVLLFVVLAGMLSARKQLSLRLEAQPTPVVASTAPASTEPDKAALLEKEYQSRIAALSAREAQLGAEVEQFSAERDMLLRREATLETMASRKEQISNSLREQLAEAGVEADIDTLYSNVRFGQSLLFEENRFVLSDIGKAFLKEFIPIYLDVLLSSEYAGTIQEIQIVGHADDGGAFGHNLELSQNRAAAVASFLVESGLLKTASGEDATSLLTISGRSYNEPILIDGVVNKEMSRRVEMKFRLVGEELVTSVHLEE